MTCTDHRILSLLACLPCLALAGLTLAGCPADDGGDDGMDGAEDGTTSVGGGDDDDDDDDDTDDDDDDDDDDDGDDESGDTGEPGDPLQAALLLERLPGLWAAPVTSQTSVGDFPIMNMDVRPADDRALFARVDLDGDNNLRFLFAFEEHPELGTVLVFRNGGYFLGILRDTRTQLVDYDPDTDTWQFCAITGGCGYIDARFSVSDDGQMDLEVDVMTMSHFQWSPSRVEARELSGAFPYDDEPGAPGDPFPPMPTLDVTMSWTTPAEDGAEAWLILFTEMCAIDAGADCNPARFYRAPVDAGATEVSFAMEQIHAGSYFGLGVLDGDGNLASTLLPGSGDTISMLNVPVTVDAEGSSAEIDLFLPL